MNRDCLEYYGVFLAFGPKWCVHYMELGIRAASYYLIMQSNNFLTSLAEFPYFFFLNKILVAMYSCGM